MSWAISPFPVPSIWYPNTNTAWNVASLHKGTILPPPVEERGSASCWILCSRIPASSVICWRLHWGRIVFWLLISGPDLCDSSGCAMRTEFKRDCMQRHPCHLLRKSFYLILNVYVLSIIPEFHMVLELGLGGIAVCFIFLLFKSPF